MWEKGASMCKSFWLIGIAIPFLWGLLASCAITPTTPTVKPIVKSDISALPLPGPDNLPIPSGTGCNLIVVSWAGFDGAASYSFDDGQPSHIAHWQDLKATEVPMTFYLVPGGYQAPGYDAAWKDALASGCELGNHTNKHQQLSAYADDAAKSKDITDCADYITNNLGQAAPCSFAYPFGDVGWKNYFNGQFLLARSVYSGTIKPLDSTDPLVLPIFAVASSHTETDFNNALDKSAAEKSWVIFMYHSLLPGDNWYAGVPCDSVTGSIMHARATGKLWIDTVERIGAYWLAQKQFAGISAQGDSSSKTWTWTLPAHFPAGSYLRVRVDGGTLSQNSVDLPWNGHGFYEVALDAGTLEWRQ
jgi:peptidoglycan/xylan/chitin deacetylase (PgdA/CDA1 family)